MAVMGRRGHIAAIDGLRALAIVGVVGYHTRPVLIHGGFLGVTIFFVISGFLITRGIESELLRSRSFSYGTYLMKRVKRLVPPVFVLIMLVLLCSFAFAPALLPKAQADALPSALFVSNWVDIFRHTSYFANAGLPSPLLHLWYLGVLMQFYILWPLALLVMHRCGTTRHQRMGAIIALMVASTVLMGLLYDPAGDASRVYYGLDTRLAELLVGALLAVGLESVVSRTHGAGGGARVASSRASGGDVVPEARNAAPAPAARIRLGDVVASVLALALVVLLFAADSRSTWLYRGGYLAFALAVAAVLAASMRPANVVGKVLGSSWLRYLGSRSFSLYLVHYPMLEMMNPATRTTRLAWWEWIVQAAALLAVTEVFYQLFERMSKSGKVHAALRASRDAVLRVFRRCCTFVSAAAIALVAVLPLNWSAVAQARSDQLRPRPAATSSLTKPAAAASPSSSQTAASDEGSPSAAASPTQEPLQAKAEKVPQNLDASRYTFDAATGTCSADPLIISDSVEMGAAPLVQEILPNALQDNLVGRSLVQFPSLYAQHVAEGWNGSVVIAALGGNDTYGVEGLMQAVIDAVGDKPLYFITIREPQDRQDANNQTMRELAATYPNVGIMDWYGLSEGHSEYLVDDGIHLTSGAGGGQEAYAKMIREALCGQ